MFGAISEKSRAFDMKINFAIPRQFLTFDGGWGNSFFKVTKFLSLYQSIHCVVTEHFMPFFEQRISGEEFPSRVIRNITQYGDVIASSLQFESDIVALEVLWLEVR